MTQLDLLAYPNTPGYKAPGPSAEAAEAMKPTATELQYWCLHALQRHPEGLTADECATQLTASVLSIRPRFSELLARKLIVDTGIRRPNASGRNATVWRIA